MVDYRKDTGAAGTMIIRDNGTQISYLIENRGSQTFANGKSWSGKVNGVTVGGTFSIQRSQTITVGTWNVSTSQTVTFTMGATGTSGLGGPTTFQHAISRPVPNAPTGLTVTRVSDGQQKLNWSRTSTYTSVLVQRRETSGGAFSSWVQVGAPTGNAYTFTDSTTKANRRYEYRVAGRNANGTSAWSGTAGVYTTPAVPTGVSAARSGANIIVSATGTYASGYDIRDGATTVASNVGLPYTHVTPNPAVPHTYTVRAVRGSLASGWSQPSNTVQLITPPNAPVSLSPNGAVREADTDGDLSWVHNPVDSSPQSAYEVQSRVDGGAWVTVGGGSDEHTPWTWALGVMEWQVRTKGAHPDWSPWSAVAVVTGIDAPGVAIIQPDTDWDASALPVEWTWFQAQGYPQSAWRLELLDASLSLVQARSGSGATTAVTLSGVAQGDYTLRVQAATGDVWSPWAEETFTVTFDPPAPPQLSGEWSEDAGVVNLTVTPGAVEGPVDIDDLVSEDRWVLWDAIPDTTAVEVVAPFPPATVRLTVERLDGDNWAVVFDGPAGSSFPDAESPSYADIVYRATAYTVEGASTVTEIIVPARSGALWLSSGPGFMTTCRLPMNPDVQPTGGRARVLKEYAGRSKPVAYVGEMTSLVWQVSGRVTDQTFIEPTATPDELLELARSEEALFLFRDPDGRRIYGIIGQISLQRQMTAQYDDPLRPWNGFWGFSVAITEATGE